MATGNVEAPFSGAFAAFLRDEAGGVWTCFKRDRYHFVGCRHFEIQRFCDLAFQPRHIRVADVAAVLAQVCCDTVRPRLNRDHCGTHWIRECATARVAHGSYMINVHAKAKRRCHYPFTRSTLFTTSLRLNDAIIPLSCFRSNTSKSMTSSRKSGERSTKVSLSILAPCSPITLATVPSVPGSLIAVTTNCAGNRSRLSPSRSQRTSSQRSG